MPQWKIQLIQISRLTQWNKNPRRLSKAQYSSIKACIDKFGLIDKPIINKDFTIIGGHQRVRILIDQGIKEVECYVPDELLDIRECEELALSLNKKTGDWDWDKLANEFDIESLLAGGFEAKDFQDKLPPVTRPQITFEFDSQEDLDRYSDKLMSVSLELERCKMKVKNAKC